MSGIENLYRLANSIYEENQDIDFLDYDDTREQSISYIMSMIDNIGESATRALLTTF